MDLWDIIRMLFRRWYLTLPLLAIAAGGAYYAAQGIEPTYTASAAGVFLEPVVTLPLDQLAPNPWVQAGVATTASAVVGSAVDPITKSKVVADGFAGDYTVLLASRSVLFSVYAPASTPDEATATLDHVLGVMRDDLRAKQDTYNVPADQQLVIQAASGTSIVATRDGIQRVLLAVAGLGIVLTTGIVVLVDSLLARRKTRGDLRRRAVDLGDGLPDEEVDTAGADGAQVEGAQVGQPSRARVKLERDT